MQLLKEPVGAMDGEGALGPVPREQHVVRGDKDERPPGPAEFGISGLPASIIG